MAYLMKTWIKYLDLQRSVQITASKLKSHFRTNIESPCHPSNVFAIQQILFSVLKIQNNRDQNMIV